MPTLSKELRRTLENTVAEARRIAEAGADQSLKQLAVHHSEPWPALTSEERAFREKLRAHGKQLGDRREPNRTQETTRLKQACAYGHWHRMLFARFLAENDLLIHPEYGQPISMDELKELAREQGGDWLTIAASFAQQMLSDVFRPGDPVLELTLPPETRERLEEKLTALATATFTAEDSLGWVYQFWQRDEKDAVNKSAVKIGADEIAPVTQLFTEDYMVLFLLHNTLGAWWTAKRRAEGLDPAFADYEWTYLRLDESGSPAMGSFDEWPRVSKEVRLLDPCMGSGHFLTFALPILVRMRQEEEGMTTVEAVRAVLNDNLFGLELDARCSQIAAFNLALTAWRIIGTPAALPSSNLACSGLGINAKEEDWVRFAGENERLRGGMRLLYGLFQQAPTLGSLISPKRMGGNLFIAEFEQVQHLVESALATERVDVTTQELATTAQGLLKAARILADTFTLIATNVPYLGQRKQSGSLKEYCEEFHARAKHDLATCFVERCFELCARGGCTALVTPQNWLFLSSYKGLRQELLTEDSFGIVARLGAGAFETIGGEVVNVALVVGSRTKPKASSAFLNLDVSQAKTPESKAQALRFNSGTRILQSSQLKNPDYRITGEASSGGQLLESFTISPQGIKTGDDARWRRCFWEFCPVPSGWRFYQSPVASDMPFGGREHVIDWRTGGKGMVRPRLGNEAVGQRGIGISAVGQLVASIYTGEHYDSGVATIVPIKPEHLPAMWTFCSSPEFKRAVREIDKKVAVTNMTLVKVPFDLAFWQSEASDRYPDGLPKPFSDDPSQWLFSGHPRDSASPLQAAVARLVGYQWPRQTGYSFPDCQSLGPDGLEVHADSDGIMSLSSLSGEPAAGDRLRSLLAEAYGPEWSAAKLDELLSGYGSLELWLRDRFFDEHCDLFHGRPFVWHVWDGRKDGFHALVNYHCLAGPHGQGRKTLEKLIYTSLGDWISRQRAEVSSGADGAEARLSAALHLQGELKSILEGQPPYDLFARWKPLGEQALGWDPDLNDGVRVNIRPWLTAKPYQATSKDGCILRTTPIKLPIGKDRGKEAPPADEADFPWFGDSTERDNDIHLSLEQKSKARERRKR